MINRFLILSTSVFILTITAGHSGNPSEEALEGEHPIVSADIAMYSQPQDGNGAIPVASVATAQDAEMQRLAERQRKKLIKKAQLLLYMQSLQRDTRVSVRDARASTWLSLKVLDMIAEGLI